MIYINDLIRGFAARLGHSAYVASGSLRPKNRRVP